LGFGVQGSGFRVQGLGFRVQGSGFRVWGSGFVVQGLGVRVWGSGFGVQGVGFRVEGAGCAGTEEGSYLRLIDFVYHSTLGWRVIKKDRERRDSQDREHPSLSSLLLAGLELSDTKVYET